MDRDDALRAADALTDAAHSWLDDAVDEERAGKAVPSEDWAKISALAATACARYLSVIAEALANQ